MRYGRKIIITSAIFIFALMAYVVGSRIGELSSVWQPWLEKTSDRPNNIPDRIKDYQIFTTPDKIIIEGKYVISEFADSNSMLPTLDYGSNGIHIDYDKSIKLEVGDIISYDYQEGNYTIVHRIIDIGVDSGGIYYITKGDNRNKEDIFKVRESQIKRVMIGVIW